MTNPEVEKLLTQLKNLSSQLDDIDTQLEPLQKARVLLVEKLTKVKEAKNTILYSGLTVEDVEKMTDEAFVEICDVCWSGGAGEKNTTNALEKWMHSYHPELSLSHYSELTEDDDERFYVSVFLSFYNGSKKLDDEIYWQNSGTKIWELLNELQKRQNVSRFNFGLALSSQRGNGTLADGELEIDGRPYNLEVTPFWKVLRDLVKSDQEEDRW